MRRNCSSVTEYMSQSLVLSDRFLQKGYHRDVLKNGVVRVHNMDRNLLILGQNRLRKINIVMDYNLQYKKLVKIVNKHWVILLKDWVLGPILPECPQFIYCRAPTLRDRIAPGVVDSPIVKENWLFFFLSGFYACGCCSACRHAKKNNKRRKEFSSFVTNKNYRIKDLIICSTQSVVYMHECDYGPQYVGRTSSALTVRIGEHVNNIKKALRSHSISKHLWMAMSGTLGV